jgi:hypothetical protein
MHAAMDDLRFQTLVRDVFAVDLADMELTVEFAPRAGGMRPVQLRTGDITVQESFPVRGDERAAREFAYGLGQQLRRVLKGY